MAATDPAKFELRGSALGFPDVAQDVADYRRTHLALVGAVAATWSQFEAAIDEHILLTGRIPEDVGRCLTAQMIGPRARLDAYIAIVRLRGGEKFAGELEKFAKQTTGLAEQRNRIVHDPWSQRERHVLRRRETTAKRSLRHEHVDVPLEILDSLVKIISRHIDKFKEMSARIEQHTSS